MKTAANPTLRLLAASLIANAGLVVALALGHAGAEAEAAAAAQRERNRPVSAPAADHAAALDPKTWERLQSGAPAEIAARLRDAGFPPRVQRALLAAHLREAHAAQFKALAADDAATPFWQTTPVNPERTLAASRLHREHARTVRELLGDDDSPSAYDTLRLDHLPPAKAAEVRAVIREFSERRSDLFAMSQGTISGGSETSRRLEAIEQEQSAALAALLGPAEFAEYELRNSRTSQSLRHSLSAFEPTEQEFRAIHALQADFDRRHGRLTGILPPEEMRARAEAQRQLTGRIKEALGPARGADYERTQDYDYRQAALLAARLELPAGTLENLAQVKRAFETRRAEIYRTPADAAARTAQLAALQQEARAAVAPLVGERHVGAYEQYGGMWLRSLAPPPAPAARK